MIQRIKNIIKQIITPKNKFVILNYHQVSDEFKPEIHSKYIWSQTEFFIKQIEFLKNNYEIVSLLEGINRLKSCKIKENIFSITFDDGDKSIDNVIVPVLKSYQIPATFFINTAYWKEAKGYWFNIFYHIENSKKLKHLLTDDLWKMFFEIRKTNNPLRYKEIRAIIEAKQNQIDEKTDFYVTETFLANLDVELFSLGLHGHEHQRFSMYDDVWQEQNIEKNILHLKNFKSYIPVFAIPFGKPYDWNSRTIEIAKSKNLEIVLANQGYNVSYTNPLMRFSVDGIDLKSLIENMSPFVKRYYKMNGL